MATSDLFNLSGRVALVTGGSRGLGLAMAHVLARAGARLAISARKDNELAAARVELEAAGHEVLTVRNDVGEAGAADALVDAVLARYGQIDILLNNAGATWGAPAEEHPLDAWRKVLDVNVNGTFALAQATAVKSMLPRKSGVIVIVASVAGLRGNQAGNGMMTAAYNTSKAAQLNLTRTLAGEWGARGIRVNALLPGWFPTKMSRGVLAAHGDDMLSRIPLGRFGSPAEDLAGPILFLASDASRYVTGASLVVDGGTSCIL